jgi:hypothetical protein
MVKKLLIILVELLSLKVRKTQHQNPEFGHTQGEIEIPKTTCKKSTLAFIQRGMKLIRKPSILVIN